MADPLTPPSPVASGGWRDRVAASKLVRVLSYADFRLLWIGTFLSFVGSWIQNVAQGYFVYQLTGDESKLALVTFCGSFPVFLFGLLAGSLADTMNRRRVLIATQALFAVGALYLAAATYLGFVAYWQVVLVALLLGLVSCIEMPTRQSIVSRVVPMEDLAAAVPVSAMTFNFARVIGPAIGALLLTKFGVATCYLLNGLSFLALIWAAVAIRSDLTVQPREPQPITDLIFEGAIYTWRERRLRTLLILESITAMFGIFYIPLIPAYVDQALGLGRGNDLAKSALGHALTAIGIGAMVGLFLTTALSDSPHKRWFIRGSMLTIGIGLVSLSTIRDPFLANVVMGFVGGATIVQFNGTNALFQILSPERLRGRVLSMHIWALNGLSPFGVLAFGWLANTSRKTAQGDGSLTGVRLAMLVGGSVVLLGAVGAILSRRGLAGLHEGPSEA